MPPQRLEGGDGVVGCDGGDGGRSFAFDLFAFFLVAAAAAPRGSHGVFFPLFLFG